jgi:nucleoside-diphosphate-sugar epimerase
MGSTGNIGQPDHRVMGPILVTGGTGFVGSHLTRALLRRGRHVIVVDRAPRIPNFVLEDDPPGKLTYLCGDINDPGCIVAALVEYGTTEVIHTAAIAVADAESLADPRLHLRVNAEATWQLCDLARHLPNIRRIVTVSTRAVYGLYTPEEGPIDENAAPRPEAFYGASKAAADLGVVQYREHFGLDVVIARLVGAYGPYQHYPGPLAQMVDAVVEGRPYRQATGGDYLRELTYVKDVVRGLLTLLDAKQLQHPIYNVSSGFQVPLTEVAAILRQLVPGASIELGSGWLAGAPPRAALSVERLAAETGFRVCWSLEDGIRELVACKRSGVYGAPVEEHRSQVLHTTERR